MACKLGQLVGVAVPGQGDLYAAAVAVPISAALGPDWSQRRTVKRQAAVGNGGKELNSTEVSGQRLQEIVSWPQGKVWLVSP